MPGHDSGACRLEGEGNAVLVLGGGQRQGRQHTQEHVRPVGLHRLMVCTVASHVSCLAFLTALALGSFSERLCPSRDAGKATCECFAKV